MTNNSTSQVFRIVLGVLMLFLLGALFRLQVVKGDYYERIAQSNFVRIRRVVATRGEIYDSKYRPIVTNIPSHNLYLTSGKINNMEKLSEFLKKSFTLDPEALRELVFEQRFKTYEEILIADNIPYETVLTLSERMDEFPELYFRNGTTRSYMYPSHFTGYVGRINKEEYDLYREEDYSLNAYVGKTGLEFFYEVFLRGKDGKEVIQVDAQGRSLEFFPEDTSLPPRNGLSLVLSIDNDLQQFANEVFPAGRKGSVIVADIKTGGILAYVSKPEYDPNVFMQRISPEVWEELNSPEKPLLDRNIQATYPPGSVYKPVIGTKGLEAGVIDRNTKLARCVGGMQIGNRFFRCWKPEGHGSTSIVDALRFSCDVFFYDLIGKLDLDAVMEHAKASGVVDKTGIDLPNERNGFFPGKAYYENKLGTSSGLRGHKANLGIGQGEVLTTPLQINSYFAAIARDGLWIQPHLLTQTVGDDRITREQLQPLKKFQLPCSRQNLRIIQDGLWAVCNTPGGTALAINVPGTTTFGKTGSAENFMGKKTHAWFTGYIVTEEPEIVITVFLENAGGGGAMAAPVANKIFNFYIGNLEMIRKPAAIPPQFLTEGESQEEETAAGEETEEVRAGTEDVLETPENEALVPGQEKPPR